MRCLLKNIIVKMLKYKVILLGFEAVGKTAIVSQYIDNHFPKVYDPTVEDGHEKQVNIYGRVIKLSITDPSGSYDYVTLQRNYIAQGDGFIVVYSVTDDESLKFAKDLLALIKQERPGAPILLVANKNDDVANRHISYMEGLSLASHWRIPFMEISAKAPTPVNEVFDQIAKLMRPLPINDNTGCLCKGLIITLIMLFAALIVLIIQLL